MSALRHGWVDASAGVAGDMLLAALLDAGASLDAVRDAVEAVLPGAVRLTSQPVQRCGLRALLLDVDALEPSPPHRRLADLLALLDAADLAEAVRASAAATFRALAEAEAAVHGTGVEEVHFHEVGALDSVADVVGVCAAVHDLGLTSLSAGPVALGHGRMRAAHGDLPVPGPAVTELARGWVVEAGGPGERATPTGLALVRTLATACEPLPRLVVDAVGTGAGHRDDPDRPNVTRVVVGARVGTGTDSTQRHAARRPLHPASSGSTLRQVHPQEAVQLEANVDDLDPRVWPTVLAALLDAGADDAWLVPVVMKKGRPAHTLCALVDPDRADAVRAAVVAHTTTFGVREHPVTKHPLARGWVDVAVDGHPVAVKVAHADGLVVRATPEFDVVAAVAAATGHPVLDVLDTAHAAAHRGGVRAGAPVPEALRDAVRRPDPTEEPL
ncbi:nickel pincer cofactor biosynthesis protein LarC [Lapillicoccus jejuensis]|uniref:Pyridinium-3,5-bisthiocarboxylic acid mononucleotide nickel insertion protein n=1 Tax=Lapillicoccus jejuensis TaxID=402171 RepID=A0A542E5A0_9MICO|nr:nickel pincer cofactor biosynthesis protein LarC [Lapillicoccus jejuensis]TQJ10497.1 hypothetical protein FB458_3621 [Lapillicoccus jejuensis]